MLEILRPFFRGEWERYGESLRLAVPSGRQESVADWLAHPARLDDALARHAAFLNHAQDRRAVASDWSAWYFAALLPPAVAMLTLVRHVIPTSWREMTLDLNDHGVPMAFAIGHLGTPAQEAPTMSRYEPLLCQHLEPLVALLHRQTRVSMRVVWGNVHRTLTTLFEHALELVGATSPLGAWLVEDREQLLESAYLPTGRSNPLHLRQKWAMVPAANGPARMALHASCCLAYRLPLRSYCQACPIATRHI